MFLSLTGLIMLNVCLFSQSVQQGASTPVSANSLAPDSKPTVATGPMVAGGSNAPKEGSNNLVQPTSMSIAPHTNSGAGTGKEAQGKAGKTQSPANTSGHAPARTMQNTSVPATKSCNATAQPLKSNEVK